VHPSSTEVLIIGAGPVGLTLATDLARRGVDVRIADREPTAGRASKAKTIQPRALEVLDDLGAIDDVLRVGVTGLPMRFHDAGGTVIDKPTMSVRADDAFSTPYPDPVWIAQFDVDAALRRRLETLGVRVEFGTEATFVAQDAEGTTTRLSTSRGEEDVRARYVVAADGGRSSVRKQVGLPLVGQTYENQRWYLGDVTVPDLDRGFMHVWASGRGMLGLTPLPGTDLWQFQSPIPPDEEPVEPSLGSYQALFDNRVGAGQVTLTSATWLSVYRVNVRMVEHYRRGRVLLAGDAAHVHSPAGGQGMNTGIQDAYNLGWKLAAVVNGAGDALLDTYGSERIPVARAVLDDSTRKMGKTLGTVTAATEKGLAGALGSIADDITTGLPIGYPGSSLTLPMPSGRHAPVMPGDRAPDARGLRGPDFDGSLFDLFRGTHWTLLAFTGEDVGLGGDAVHVHRIGRELIDTEGHVARVYGPEQDELILVRPDGYVAARLPLGEVATLVGHLAALT
jgi:2-polyprenyl-6-methoxyphenol hydroxylase-like FAD-dependent oxidoreductase